ncbi:MAG: AsmA family protein [Segetibacter sp.]|nr:AsmA family protein [Segetibacter sp.]
MNKYLKYTLRGLGIFAAILVIVYTVAYIYVLANKQKIITQIKEQVSDKLNGEVQIGNIDLGFLANFPSIGVELEKVSIRDTLFNLHKHPFFQAEKVNASISFINLLTKKNPLNGIRIDNGQVYIYTDTSGYTNSYLLSPKSKPDTAKKTKSGEVEIEEIKLRNVRLVLDDRKKLKLYDFAVTRFNATIKDQDSILQVKTKNDILVHNLAFITRNGSFLRETHFEGDFKIFFNKVSKQLKFDDIDITLKDHPFVLSGIFNFNATPSFALKVVTKDIDYNFGRSLLTEKISRNLNKIKVEKPIDEVFVDISGPLKGDPLVNVKWKVSNNNVQSPFAALNDCSFTGGYTNELVVGLPRKDPNSRLQLHDFTGNYHGLKMVSKNIYIDNLTFPMLNCDVKTDFTAEQLNTVLGSGTIDIQEGRGSIDLSYSGPLQENSNNNTLINGKVTFADGLVHYEPTNIRLKNVNGNIVFKNSDVFVNDLRADVLDNKIMMNGSGKNLLAIMKTNPGRMVIDWNIYSPSINLGNFTSLLKKRTVAVKKKTASSKLGANVDAIVHQANFRLDVKADALTYKRFSASNVKASVSLLNDNWILNNVSLQHAGGSMTISGALKEKSSKMYGADVKVNMQNVDVNKVFYAFDNFGQKGITAENLRGKLTSQVDVKMDIDRELEGTPSNMEGFVDFSLKNGALLHYEPLQKVQTIVFKKRNFDEIYFAELKNRFDIKDREIKINRMEIQSTVLTLFVEGVYSLRGNTDIVIQVPLSNIRKREEGVDPANKGADSKGGASVFVRGQPGTDGNIQFKLDLFKKFRKKKEG